MKRPNTRLMLFVALAAALAGCKLQTVVKAPRLPSMNIIFIGNSITRGAGLKNAATEAPPVFAVSYLKKQSGIDSVKFLNHGVSGYTTVDFLPQGKTVFNKAIQAADGLYTDKRATLVFSIELGTNDSAVQGPNGAPVSPEGYRANLKVIADSLLKRYPECRIVLHYPIWYSPNTYNRSKYLEEGLNRLISYSPEIEKLIKDYSRSRPNHVFEGDKQAFEYFRKNHETDFQHEQGQQGIFYLHPNKQGAEVLGNYWGGAIYRAWLKW